MSARWRDRLLGAAVALTVVWLTSSWRYWPALAVVVLSGLTAWLAPRFVAPPLRMRLHKWQRRRTSRLIRSTYCAGKEDQLMRLVRLVPRSADDPESLWRESSTWR